MKLTFTVQPESWAHKAIEAIMFRMKFSEESRVASGGYMSDPVIIVTYSGAIVPSALEFGQKNYYVKFPVGSEGTYYQFYSLLCPEGFQTNDIAKFQAKIESRTKQDTVEVEQFNQQ